MQLIERRVVIITIKLLAFDLDGTIAAHDESAFPYSAHYLKEFSDMGIKLLFISAKPSSYIAGFVRNLGIKDALIGGENGTELLSNLHYPVQKVITYKYTNEQTKVFDSFKREVIQTFGDDIWIQPNVVTFCFFLKNKERFNECKALVDSYVSNNPSFSYYLYREPAFEIYPTGINKSYGIQSVCEMLRITPNEIIAMGDGENDVAMFKEVKISIGIGRKEAKYFVEAPKDGFEKIMEILKQQKV